MINMERVALWIGIAGILCAAIVGYLIETTWLPIVAAAIVGATLASPIVMFIESKERHWLAIFVILLILPLSFYTIGWQGPLLIFTTAATALYGASSVLRGLFFDSRWEAFRHMIRLLRGSWLGFQLIGDGRSILPAGDGPVFGPRNVIIQPNNAVIFQSGWKQTSVAGPSRVETKPFEHARSVIDLRPHKSTSVLDNAITSNGLKVSITISSLCGLKISRAARSGDKALTDTERKVLQKIDALLPAWRDHTCVRIASITREHVAHERLEDLLDSAAYLRLAMAIQTQAKRELNQWGIWVYLISVDRIQPQVDLINQMGDEWITDRRRVALAAGDAHDEVMRARSRADALILLAQGYMNARNMPMPDHAIEREVLRLTLENLLAGQEIGPYLSQPVSAALRELMRSLGINIP